jgi:hypothetical protein
MKVIFLDIDGVLNCEDTGGRRHGRMVIEPRLAEIVRSIAAAVPDLRVVLSSSWREVPARRRQIEKMVLPCFDATPVFDADDDVRGFEIQAWIESTPQVTHYAIIDDADDMLPHQLPHLFRTDTAVGITPELAARIVDHLIR